MLSDDDCVLGFGMGTPAPGEPGGWKEKLGSLLPGVIGLRGDMAGTFENEPWRDLVAPGKPVKGFMTSETAEPRRGRAKGPSLPAEMDSRGEGRAKLEGVRGRETGGA